MSISNIFSVINGGTGTSATKAALANVGKVPVNPTDAIFKQAKAPSATGSTTDDSVDVSSLSKAMTDRAAEFFSHMDEKQRGALETLVKSGRISAEEAVKGLQYWADETSFFKSMGKVPPTQEEIENRAASQALYDRIKDRENALVGVTQAADAIEREYAKATSSGAGNLDEISARLKEARQTVDDGNKELSALWEQNNIFLEKGGATFTRRAQVVAQAKAASGHPDGAVV